MVSIKTVSLCECIRVQSQQTGRTQLHDTDSPPFHCALSFCLLPSFRSDGITPAKAQSRNHKLPKRTFPYNCFARPTWKNTDTRHVCTRRSVIPMHRHASLCGDRVATDQQKRKHRQYSRISLGNSRFAAIDHFLATTSPQQLQTPNNAS